MIDKLIRQKSHWTQGKRDVLLALKLFLAVLRNGDGKLQGEPCPSCGKPQAGADVFVPASSLKLASFRRTEFTADAGAPVLWSDDLGARWLIHRRFYPA